MSAPTQEPNATAPMSDDDIIASIGSYEYGWHDADLAGQNAQRGLSEDVVRRISGMKNEPEWMLKQRLKALRLFDKKPMPNWGSDLSGIDFDNIKYFVRSTENKQQRGTNFPKKSKTPMTVSESPKRKSNASLPV